MEAVRNSLDIQKKSSADEIFEEAASVWKQEEIPVISKRDRREIRETALSSVHHTEHGTFFADACECFYLFRIVHRYTQELPGWAVLTGDYFFSRFSHALIPIDNVELIDRFSDYLKKDAKADTREFDLAAYLAFIRQTAAEMRL